MIAEAERDVGPIDMLVNSAGAARRYAPADLDAAAWHAAMDAKYFSYIHPLGAALKRMVTRGRGAIVNVIGSGGKVANPVHLPGGAANAALMLATTGLAAAFGPKGIRINAINPGITLTGRVQEGLAVEAKMTGLAEAELLKRSEARIPLGRARHAGGSRSRRAVPRVRRGELCDGRHRPDGRRGQPRHLKDTRWQTDIEIAQQAKLKPIGEIAARLGHSRRRARALRPHEGEGLARLARATLPAGPAAS